MSVHKQTVVACVVVTRPDGSVPRNVRTFSTMTVDLLALDDWLRQLAITVIALESTGIYWRPVYQVIAEGRTVLLVNPQHMKAGPGRKTDVKDREWLADLRRHGLLHASFIPPQPIRDLRELTRYRTTLVQERAAEVNRVQKVLEPANLKLSAVASDVLGKSGRAMLEALIDGTNDVEILAQLARGRLRAKLPELRQTLEGRVNTHHRFLLGQLLAHIEYLEEALATLPRDIEPRLQPYTAAVEQLQSIPGIRATTAAVIVAEIGIDMSRFASAKHLRPGLAAVPETGRAAASA